MADLDIPTIINSAIVLLGVIGVPVLAVVFKRAKGKLKQAREFFDELDDDLADDHLTEEEYADLVAKGKALFS